MLLHYFVIIFVVRGDMPLFPLNLGTKTILKFSRQARLTDGQMKIQTEQARRKNSSEQFTETVIEMSCKSFKFEKYSPLNKIKIHVLNNFKT